MSSTSFSSLLSHLDLSRVAFNAQQFQSLLTTTLLGRYFLYRSTCDSTMEIAKRESVEGAPSGTLVLAEQQLKGRGRIIGRNWISPPNNNLYFTVILHPIQLDSIKKLNFAMSSAICYGINQLLKFDAARVKWPNDIWIAGKKVAGVLVDVDIIGREISVSIGVGINVHGDMSQSTDPVVKSSATSIQTALTTLTSTGTATISREQLLASILNQFESLLIEPFSTLLSLYRNYDCLVGNTVTVMPRKREDAETYYEATATRFSEEGYLMVKKTGEENEQALVAEEVTIRPAT